MDENLLQEQKEKLKQTDPYDFDIKYSSTSPKSDLNELKNKNQVTSEINNSNQISLAKEVSQEPIITGRDSEILFEKDQTPLVKQSSLNGDEEEIQSSGANSVDNKRISDLVRSNMERRKTGHLSEFKWDSLGLNVKKESLTEE